MNIEFIEDALKYKRLYALTIAMAEQILCCPLTPQTKREVSALYACMSQVDTYIDQLFGSDKRQGAQNILDVLEGKPCDALSDHPILHRSLLKLRDTLDVRPKEKKEAFISNVRQIFICGEVLATTRNSQAFVRARKEEGKCTAELVLLCSPQLDENQNFRNFYQQAAICGNLFDSLIDMKGDRQRGELKVPLSVIFRLSTGACAHALPAFQAYPRKTSLFGIAGQWAMHHLRHAIAG